MGSTGIVTAGGKAFTRREQLGNDSPCTGERPEGRKLLPPRPQLPLLEVLFYFLNTCTVLIYGSP